MRIEEVGGEQYWVVTKPKDVEGWEILYVEDFKPGVKRLHVKTPWMVTPPEFRLLYCSDEFLPDRLLKERGEG